MGRIRLLTNAILKTFIDLVYHNRGRIRRIWLVTPWIGGADSGRDPLYILVDALRTTSCHIVLITRPPREIWHEKAVLLLERHLRTTVYLCESLHTKLYLLECDGFRAAVLGSPNLTPRGDRVNREIAVELRSTYISDEDELSAIINELIEYASALRGEDDVLLKQPSK